MTSSNGVNQVHFIIHYILMRWGGGMERFEAVVFGGKNKTFQQCDCLSCHRAFSPVLWRGSLDRLCTMVVRRIKGHDGP